MDVIWSINRTCCLVCWWGTYTRPMTAFLSSFNDDGVGNLILLISNLFVRISIINYIVFIPSCCLSHLRLLAFMQH